MKDVTNKNYYNGGDLNFSLALERGKRGEDAFTDLIMNNPRVEVKYESHQWVETGNIFCEFEQMTRRDGKWIKSGFQKDYDVMAYGLNHPDLEGEIFIVAKKDDWVKLMRSLLDVDGVEIKEKSSNDGTNFTRGLVVPLSKLLWNKKLHNNYIKKMQEDIKKRLKQIWKQKN